MSDRSIAHVVRYTDVRIGRQFDEHANSEHVTCSLGCAASHLEDRGFDASRAKDVASGTAWVPHLSGENGHGAYLRKETPEMSDTMRQLGARCAHCRGTVG